MMMRHLLWKDAMTVRPLLFAVAAGIVGLNLLMIVMTMVLEITDRESANLFVSLWILMPNLVALGTTGFVGRQ